MAISAGDIIQFDLRGNFKNLVETHNVFHYEVGGYTGTRTPFQWISDAAKSWVSLILDDILDISTNNMHYNQITAKIIFGANAGVQNAVVLDPTTYTGTNVGDALPPNVVWTFRKQGSGGTERNGYQHYSGVPESASLDGFPVTEVMDELTALAGLLEGSITVFLDGDDSEASQGGMLPVIVKRVANGENPDDVDVLAKWYPVGVSFAKIGTVNSRKYGVGV